MFDRTRTPVGFWLESPAGAQWANQGMTRLVGFLVEGAALDQRYVFRIVATDDIRDEAEEDLKSLNAKLGLDYTIHSPRDVGIHAATFEELAEFANKHVNVRGWISVFPNFTSAKFLDAPVSTIFPDAIGLAYHDFSDTAWNERGHHVIWRNMVTEHLETSNNVITFSRHVANDHVKRFFDVHESRIRVIPHAPPTLNGLLPFVKNGSRNEETLFRAATMLRRYCAERSWDYLVDFPFEHVRYIAVSTQDRVTKNIRIVADAIERLVRRDHDDFKMFMTAQLHFGTGWTPLPRMIETAQIQFDVVSMPDLPRDVHAAFYHCAEIAVHPSVFEGGRGVFPYYEAISVGTPCIMANGPHVVEFLDDAPELTPFVFDPNDADGLAALIRHVSSERESITYLQSSVYTRLCTRGWDEVAVAYARAATDNVSAHRGGHKASTSRIWG